MPKILVVEDNPVTRKLVRAALVREGFTVEESESGQQAMQQMAASPPDLILQDLVLPDMNGFELLTRLRALPGGGAKPIVALTGLADEPRLREAGFNDVLVKPVEPSRLVKAVRGYLQRPIARGTDPENRRRLLLVDADAIRLGNLQDHFSRLGFLTTTASDGIEALSLAREVRPDVIVADVLIPQLNGFELLRSVREDAAVRGTAVVLLTPKFFSRADRDMVGELGGTVVHRSDEIETLVAAVEHAAAPRSVAIAPTTEYRRGLTSVEKQDAMAVVITRAQKMQQATLSVLAALAGVAEQKRSLGDALKDVLTNHLDACGFASGAAYLADKNGALWLRASVGFNRQSEGQLPSFWGHLNFLRNVMARAEPVAYRSPGPSERVAHVLRRSGAESLLLAPLVLNGARLGMLVFSSASRELPEDWLALAKAVSGPIAQAVGLARAVEGLLRSETRFRAIAETAEEATVIADDDGSIVFINPVAEVLLGLPAIDAHGRLVRELLPFVDAKPGGWRGVVHTRDGRRVPVEVQTRTLAAEAVYVVRDLSHRATMRQIPPGVIGKIASD